MPILISANSYPPNTHSPSAAFHLLRSIYILEKYAIMRAQTSGRDNKMIRLASVGDAGELERLNAEFNGKGKTTEESIRASLTNRRDCHRCGRQRRTARRLRLRSAEKIVLLRRIYARDNRGLCPSRVSRAGRRAEMLTFAQEYCKTYLLHSFELLTGDNTAAQKLYSAIGFECSGEIHMSKQVK